MSGQEIERKFLVRGDGYRKAALSSTRIRQGYIMSQGGRNVRVRIRGDKGYLTIKGPSQNGGLSRYEFETAITLDEAEHLMALCEPGIIDKRRYLVPSPDGRHTFEVDEFYGGNAGLVMAEVELGNEQEPFKKPDFIGKEVTGDGRFYNSHMRKMPYVMWRGTIPPEYRHPELETDEARMNGEMTKNADETVENSPSDDGKA